MYMVSLSSGPKGHRATVAPRWEEDLSGGLVRSWGSNGGNLGGPGKDAACSPVLSDLAMPSALSSHQLHTPPRPLLHSCSVLRLHFGPRSNATQVLCVLFALAVIYSMCGLSLPRSSHPPHLAQVQLGRPQGGLGPRADSPRPSPDLPLGGAAPSQSPSVYAGGWHGCSRNECLPLRQV